MNIQLRYFASVRETVGQSDEWIELPASVNTVGAVRAHLCQRGGVWAQALGPERTLRMAYAHQMTQADTVIEEGGEVAFFPPVTGG